MKNLFYLIIFFYFVNKHLVFSQKNIFKNGLLTFNVGNSTPIIGASYHKSFRFDTLKTRKKHWEGSLGIGFVPSFFPLSINLPFGHSICHVWERKKTELNLGYIGILTKKEPNYRVDNYYIPGLQFGFRILGKSSNIGTCLNAYLYKTNRWKITDNNNVYTNSQYKISIYPGFYFGIKI